MSNTGHREYLRSRADKVIDELSGTGTNHRGGHRELLEELRLLQAELREQNGDLARTHAQLEESQEKYRELYDFAPMGYMTLDQESIIREINLRGCSLLGLKRESLLGQSFPFFLAAVSRERFYQHRADVFEHGHAEPCEVQLCVADVEALYLRIHSSRGVTAGGKTVMRLALVDISDSRRAEVARRASERRYRSMVETTQEGVILLDSQRCIAYVNVRMAELLGYEAHEMIGRPIVKFIDDKEIARMPACGERRVRGTRERSFVRRDGGVVCVLVSMSPMSEGADGYLEMVTDITQRKVMEEAIRRSEQRYALAQRAAKMGSWEWDMESGTLEWSEGISQLFGVAEGNLSCSYEDFLERIHPDDRPRVDQTLRACIETGREYDIEHRVVWPDGSLHWVSEIGGVVYDDEGTAVRMLGIIQDITRRKRVEMELSQARGKLEKTVQLQSMRLSDTQQFLSIEIMDRVRAEEALSQRQQALEAVYTLATASHSSEKAILDQIVLSIADMLGTPLVAIGHMDKGKFRAVSQVIDRRLCAVDECINMTCMPCQQVYHDRKAYQYSSNLDTELRELAQAHGEEFGAFIGVPVIDDEGDVRAVIMALDHRPRTFIEYEVHLIEVFARYIAHEYTRQRLETQVRQAQEMRMLGQLTSGVAHEVRNPLNAIGAIAEALFQELGDNPEYEPYRRHIDNQVKRLSMLMEDLLSLGRPIRQSEFHEYGIVQIATHALSSLRHSPQATGRTIRLVKEPEADVWRVRADSGKLQQVFINLLENACHHSPETEPVDMVFDRADERTVRVRIIDRGTGVPAEFLTRLFEPFFTTRKAGTGLGLTIVHHLVESHGGAIHVVNNEPSPGLTAEVMLPIAGSTGTSALVECGH